MEKLTALRVFRRVVELESFSKAARDLRISNAAASKNVRELEEELGAPLLQRTTRRLHLTAVGEAYFDRVVKVLDDLAAADRAVKESNTTLHGLVRIAAPMSLGLTKVMPALADLLVHHPELQIEVDMNDRVVDMIHEGYDLCIRGGSALPDSSLVARKLLDLDRYLVAAPSYLAHAGEPRYPSELTSHRCLVYSLSPAGSRWTFLSRAKPKSNVKRLAKSRKVDIDVKGPLRVTSSMALVQAAALGVGIALVPFFTVEHELADGRLVRLLRDWQSEPQALYAIYPRHRETSRTLRFVVEQLAARLQS